jgi:NAD(P)-dependent dehydrogenase (short-subunit alcohol dehydrogenase family)
MEASLDSLTHPTVLVTGATDGIGRQTAIALAKAGAKVILHGRDEARLTAAQGQVEEEARVFAPTYRADFASLAEVQRMAGELAERQVRLDVLINNAGVYMKEHALSADGIEMTFAVNHVAPFLLTHLILQSPVSERLLRVVNVSSVAHTRGRIDLADIAGQRLKKYDDYAAYANSKLANVLFTVELARRLARRGVHVNALHPGVVSTKLLRGGFGMEGPDSADAAVATTTLLALSPDVADVTGRYFAYGEEAAVHPIAHDRPFARRFYDLSAQLAQCATLPDT